MTFRQWLTHIRHWFYTVIQFPTPRTDTHMWVGVAGERGQTCLVCDAEGLDRDISEEELAREREMNQENEALFEKYFGEHEDV